jgi:peptidoglycan/LPS O-acetylase OafA/YrhL
MGMNKNSLDLLRLIAATMVLFSHQYALLGLAEPSFLGWNTFGGAGVAIFFFLSGFLVWSSWDRDPNAKRFFQRRSLRIFPALWFVCLLSVFVMGPLMTILPAGDYLRSPSTWRYLTTALLVSPNTLPGLFPENPMPLVVNGSLWTLPVEFLCYLTVAVTGWVLIALKRARGPWLGLCLLGVVVAASFGPLFVGTRFAPHWEMVALFWWGVYYGHCLKGPKQWLDLALAVLALVGFAMLGPRGFERTAMLVFVVLLVHLARTVPVGARLTDRLGDLSYGVYIFAFPVQQIGVQYGRVMGWSFPIYFAVSMVVTFVLAYVSWHAVEKKALRFKPTSRRAT